MAYKTYDLGLELRIHPFTPPFPWVLRSTAPYTVTPGDGRCQERHCVHAVEVGSVTLFIPSGEVLYLLAWGTIGYALTGGGLPEVFGLIPYIAIGAAGGRQISEDLDRFGVAVQPLED